MKQKFLLVVELIKKELHRLRLAFHYSLDGLKYAFRSEQAFRIELMAALILIPLALIFGATLFKKALLISVVLLVLVVELINSAIEAAVDRISEEFHPLSKIAKDAASAAVLLALLNAAFVWALLF